MKNVSINGMLYTTYKFMERSKNMHFYYKDKTLPNRFKKCRLMTGLSQSQLSNALGFKGGKATISGYEHNKRLPNIPTLIKMKKIFQVSLDYLLCLDDYPTHIDYAKNELGLDDETIQWLLELSTNEKFKMKLNDFIQHHLLKEIKIHENKDNQ